jgi:1-deoxyxylulose-5-phosphate synthase
MPAPIGETPAGTALANLIAYPRNPEEPPMEYVSFGNTGLKVSRLCLGAMTFPNELSSDESQRVIDEALDRGVNFIDTAESYGNSEEVLGAILSESAKRERVVLATKVYNQRTRDKRVGRNSRVNLIHSLERSLRLLQTDYVDLYQLHHPDPETPFEETIATLDNFVKQGKVRHVGVSNHYAWQMAHHNAVATRHHWEPLVSVQCCYNVLDRPVEIEILPFCRKFQIATMIYSPLCGGILTGKYKRGKIPAGSRAEEHTRMQQYLRTDLVHDIVDRLRRIARRNKVEMNQLAILWLLAKPVVTSVILGGSKAQHFQSIYDVADRRLSEKDVQEIDEVSAPREWVPFANQPVREGPELAEQW